jgi:DNA helicase II / ATP-dependent DNA helicase PcrA
LDMNLEQTKLVEAEPGGYTLIKGIAGSGKTTIALQRALFLHRNFCFDPGERVLLATYNRTLINYLQCIFEKVKERYDGQYANLFSSNAGSVDIQTVDQLIYHYYKEHLEEPGLKPLYDQKVVQEVIAESKERQRDVLFDLSPNGRGLSEISACLAGVGG